MGDQAGDVQPQKGGEAAGSGEAVPQQSRTMGMLAHLLGLFTSFVGPLAIWLVKKEEDPFVDDQGKEALNFQLTLVIGYVVSMFLSLICIGYFLAMAIWVIDIVFSIIACVKANSGVRYRYPICLRFIK